MTGVDVVVVTYNSADTIGSAVEQLAAVESVRVIVVDNASSDDTVELLRTLPVETVVLERNGGFAHGCNVGWRAGEAPYVLFLNPDARIDAVAVEALASELDRDDKVGAVAPRIEEPDGSLDVSLRRFPRLRSSFAQAFFLHRVFPEAAWVDEVIRDPAEYERPHPAEWVSGACFAVRRSVLEELGGLDESFFHYSEDVDICARIWRAGHEVRFVPAALAEHEGGASAPRARLLPILAASRIRYSSKHDSRLVLLAMRASVALGAATHVILARSGATRRGHLRALGVALRPLPAEPSHLVRGT
jgi:N-acetylglucosaminyl-diphospho-decaprenol L-rhamnosyltransferase